MWFESMVMKIRIIIMGLMQECAYICLVISIFPHCLLLFLFTLYSQWLYFIKKASFGILK